MYGYSPVKGRKLAKSVNIRRKSVHIAAFVTRTALSVPLTSLSTDIYKFKWDRGVRRADGSLKVRHVFNRHFTRKKLGMQVYEVVIGHAGEVVYYDLIRLLFSVVSGIFVARSPVFDKADVMSEDVR